MPDVDKSVVEHLAELHWISYSMTASITHAVPMWADLDPAQRSSLVTAMELMLTLGHLAVGEPEVEE